MRGTPRLLATSLIVIASLMFSLPRHAKAIEAARVTEPVAPGSAAVAAVVRALRERGPQVVAGATIGSVVVLPRLYEQRGFGRLWTDRRLVDDLLAAIRDAGAIGLVPADYHLATIEKLRREEADGEAEASQLDLVLTDAFVRLAYHTRFGKVDPERVDAHWNHVGPLARADSAASLQQAIDQGQIAAFLEEIGPQTSSYRRLRDGLAAYRRLAAEGGWPVVPSGPTLKPGAADVRVQALRRRLVVTGDLVGGEVRDDGALQAATRYDDALVDAVRVFQARHGLATDGIVGPGTLQALNVPVEDRIRQLRVSLERARWVQGDLPPRFVLVNVAGFRIWFIDQGERVWESRVVAGKPITATPIFRADMKTVVLNPTWTIPASIVKGEVLPAMSRDPNYLARKGYRVIDGKYVQPAGPDNALGRIKMVFPNRHAVFLHDTPSRSLFGRESRGFSHGCIRVERPVELASLALGDSAWSVEALEREIATGKTRSIQLASPVPVLVLYWTAAVEPDGQVHFLPDIYKRDPALLRELDAAPQPPKPRAALRR
ncbi:MAG: murein L,D-transpeptidase [Candidatus Binatia bacterium]